MGFSRVIPTLCALFITFSAHAEAPVASGQIVSVGGTVMVRRALQTSAVLAPAHKAEPNETLYKGDVISTGLDGTVKLIFPDDTVMDLGPRSMFKVDRFEAQGSERRAAYFTLLYGRLRALVTKAISPDTKFQVRTPDALMGVRGTEFLVNAPLAFSRGTVGTAAAMATKTELTVFTGEVAVKLPRRTEVEEIPVLAGQQLVVAAVAPDGTSWNASAPAPAPVVLPPQTLHELRSGAAVRDNTFDRTISSDSSVRNEKAPTAATPKGSALETSPVARETAANETLDEQQRAAAFNLYGLPADTPAARIPGNIQTVNIKLSR